MGDASHPAPTWLTGYSEALSALLPGTGSSGRRQGATFCLCVFSSWARLAGVRMTQIRTPRESGRGEIPSSPGHWENSCRGKESLGSNDAS